MRKSREKPQLQIRKETTEVEEDPTEEVGAEVAIDPKLATRGRIDSSIRRRET